jgi:hypothetical protein
MPRVDPTAVGLVRFITLIYNDWHGHDSKHDITALPIDTNIVSAMVARIANHREDVDVDIYEDEFHEAFTAWNDIRRNWPSGYTVEIKGFMGQEWNDPSNGRKGQLLEALGLAIAFIFERAYAEMYDQENERNPGREERLRDAELAHQAREMELESETIWQIPDDADGPLSD